jgi:hypothetical protein
MAPACGDFRRFGLFRGASALLTGALQLAK